MSRKDMVLNMRQVLIKRRDALRRALSCDMSLLCAKTLGEPENSVQGGLSSQLAEVESRELNRIEYALERMRQGQFGICEGCGTNIPLARLSALPYANFCISCQREAERQGATSPADVDWSRLIDSSNGGIELSIGDIDLPPED